MDNTFDYGLSKISIRPREHKSTSNTNLAQKKENGSTKFYCATEEGDLIVADSTGEKSNEEKGQASRVEHAFSRHFGPISDVRRSPFFPDILLSVGGWGTQIWKEGCNVSLNF